MIHTILMHTFFRQIWRIIFYHNLYDVIFIRKKWYKFFTHKFITQLGSTNPRYTFLVDFYEKNCQENFNT